jgi:hypothetical protein
MKVVLLLSALAVATASAAFAASPRVARNQPQEPILTNNSSTFSMGSAAAVPVLPQANDPNVPGATGSIVVPGNNSTIAGDWAATINQRMGAYGGGGG